MIKFETWFENEDDTRRFYCKAMRDGLTGYGDAYSPEKAKEIALASLASREKQLTPVSVNWENTPESFLASVNIRELICPDSGYCYVQ